jgi:hypothetical protein
VIVRGIFGITPNKDGSGLKNAHCQIDRELAAYYYSLLPPYLDAKRVGHYPHITVVREWEAGPENWARLDQHQGKLVTFHYGPQLIYKVGRHYIIDCHSKEMEELRIGAGLSAHREPYNCFHFTIGYLED